MNTRSPTSAPASNAPGQDVAGLTTVPSVHGYAATVQKLESVLSAKNIHLFARIDHAALAAEAGFTLRPTIVLIFGNPQAGTPLMHSRQTIGIDLPLKILVWEDDKGKTWVSYNELHYLANRHDIHDRDSVVAALSAGLEAIAKSAAS